MKVQVLMDQQVLTLEVDGANVHRLGMWARPVESSDRIYEVNITKDYVIVTTEDPGFRSGASVVPMEQEHRPVNNIQAYDWQGNPVWNIADIVGDVRFSFFGCSVNTLAGFGKVAGVDASLCDPTHEFLGAFGGCFLYLIDLQERKLIQRISGKW